MNGIELIKKAMKLEEVERAPWVPFVGVHAGTLLNVTAEEYLKSSELIVKGVSKAIEAYAPDGIPIGFDLQIEAEALGCKLAWAEENPPAVVSHPLTEGKTLADLAIPNANSGRIPLFLNAAKEVKKAYPDVALYGLITGPFTLALHLLGTDIFIKMMEDPDSIHELLAFCNKVSKQMATYYIEAGCDVIAVVDPMTSQIDPLSFELFLNAPATELFEHIRTRGALSSFFVCGFAQQNIEVMCKCKPDNVSIDENIPLDYVKDVALSNGVSFGGNIQLTVSLLMGSPIDCQKDALKCMEIGGNKGYILSPGCDLAMKTPSENLLAITELVYDDYQQEVVRNLQGSGASYEARDLTSHWKEDKVVIDIITLDSSSCAPCQYMVEAVTNAIVGLEDQVEWFEHRIKERDGIEMMVSLGVKNLPTIVIDGNVEFISQIPSVKNLKEKIISYLEAKSLENV